MSSFKVLCVAKDEPYIHEFVKHYLSIGFDEIIIGDNGLTDCQLASLEKYIALDVVKLIDIRDAVKPFQVEFYLDQMRKIKSDDDWVAKVDCDEYLDLNGIPIRKYVDRFPKNCGAIYFNWMMYRNDRLISNSIFDSRPSINRWDSRYTKTVSRYCNSMTEWVGEHDVNFMDSNIKHYHCNGMELTDDLYSHLYPKYNEDPNSSIYCDYRYGHINHYYVQSGRQWISKSFRGFSNDPVSRRSLVEGAYGLDNQSVSKDILAYLHDSNYSSYESVYTKLNSLPKVIDNYLDGLFALLSDRQVIYSSLIGEEFNQLKVYSIIENKTLIYVPK